MRPIDADLLFMLLRKLSAECEDSDDCQKQEPCITCIINSCSTLDIKPVKHGKWIIDYLEGTKIYHAHCSECNKEPFNFVGGDYYADKLPEFCPNCGARMEV